MVVALLLRILRNLLILLWVFNASGNWGGVVSIFSRRTITTNGKIQTTLGNINVLQFGQFTNTGTINIFTFGAARRNVSIVSSGVIDINNAITTLGGTFTVGNAAFE